VRAGVNVNIDRSCLTASNACPVLYDHLHSMFAALSAIVLTASPLVAIGFWGAVKEQSERVHFEAVLKHGGTAAVLLLELLISKLPVTSTWVVFPSTYVLIYTFFMLAFHAVEQEWVYSRTDFRRCRDLPGYVVVPLVVVGMHATLCAPAPLVLFVPCPAHASIDPLK
jgi:hypothetical protein